MTANTKGEEQSRAEQDTVPSPHATALPHPQQTRQHTNEDNMKGRRQCEGEDPIRTRGQHTTHRHRHSMGPLSKRKGNANIRRGCPATQTPFTHHATHHSLCHTTVHDGPTHHHCEGGADRGYPTTRTPQTHTHPHHTPGNGTVHDTTAVLTSTAVGRVGHESHHCTGQDTSGTHPPPFHTPRRMNTIHSSTHLLLLIHVHTTNDQR